MYARLCANPLARTRSFHVFPVGLAGSGNFRIKPEVLAAHFEGDTGDGKLNFKVWEKLILGSDAYFSVPEILGTANVAYRELLTQCKVPDNIVQKIMGQTSKQWLKYKRT